MDDAMPADPFREGQMDWTPVAAYSYSFFTAHLGAGFSETQALELTARYESYLLTVIFAQQAGQAGPEQGQAGESD